MAALGTPVARFLLVKNTGPSAPGSPPVTTFAIPFASVVEVAALPREQVKLSYLRTLAARGGGISTVVEELQFEGNIEHVLDALNNGTVLDLEELKKKCVEQRLGKLKPAAAVAPQVSAEPPRTKEVVSADGPLPLKLRLDDRDSAPVQEECLRKLKEATGIDFSFHVDLQSVYFALQEHPNIGTLMPSLATTVRKM
jgi:hypothetical protein